MSAIKSLKTTLLGTILCSVFLVWTTAGLAADNDQGMSHDSSMSKSDHMAKDQTKSHKHKKAKGDHMSGDKSMSHKDKMKTGDHMSDDKSMSKDDPMSDDSGS